MRLKSIHSCQRSLSFNCSLTRKSQRYSLSTYDSCSRSLASSTSSSAPISSSPFCVTSPIFYVNAAPHIGHLFTVLLCDFSARWSRLKNKPTLFCTGTDEHEFCKEVSSKFRNVFDAFDISYDDFVRTTEPRHEATVVEFWKRLENKGFIYMGLHEGWYCTSEESFLTESQVVNDTGQPVEWVKEENLMFRLSKFQKPLLNWIEKNPNVIQPKSRRNEVRSFISQGLQDISVSLGLLGFLPMMNIMCMFGPSLDCTDNPNPTAQFWPASVQIVGKDILRFHCVFWPAFLMAAGLNVPQKIIAHGHVFDRIKMSKSIGNVVDPMDLLNNYGVDPIRYFLLRDGGLGTDGDFSEKKLVQQTLNMTNRYFAQYEPWALVPGKPLEDSIRLATVMYLTQESIRVVGILLQPVIPSSSDKLLNHLGIPRSERNIEFVNSRGRLRAGNPLGFSTKKEKCILFKKM
eukprot:GSMAST32.ASY1.ANO1.200.1 assembled CDS